MLCGMRSSAPPALAACLKPRAWRLCALLGASAGRRMKALRLALRGVPVAGGFGLLARAPLTLTRGVALRRWRRTSPLSSRRLARPAPLPLLVLRSAGRRLVPLLSVLPARRALRPAPLLCCRSPGSRPLLSLGLSPLSALALARPPPPSVGGAAPSPGPRRPPRPRVPARVRLGLSFGRFAPCAGRPSAAPRAAVARRRCGGSSLALLPLLGRCGGRLPGRARWCGSVVGSARCALLRGLPVRRSRCAPLLAFAPCRVPCSPAAPLARPGWCGASRPPPALRASVVKGRGPAAPSMAGQPRNSVLPACRATGPLRSDRRRSAAIVPLLCIKIRRTG